MKLLLRKKEILFKTQIDTTKYSKNKLVDGQIAIPWTKARDKNITNKKVVKNLNCVHVFAKM